MGTCQQIGVTGTRRVIVLILAVRLLVDYAHDLGRGVIGLDQLEILLLLLLFLVLLEAGLLVELKRGSCAFRVLVSLSGGRLVVLLGYLLLDSEQVVLEGAPTGLLLHEPGCRIVLNLLVIVGQFAALCGVCGSGA